MTTLWEYIVTAAFTVWELLPGAVIEYKLAILLLIAIFLIALARIIKLSKELYNTEYNLQMKYNVKFQGILCGITRLDENTSGQSPNNIENYYFVLLENVPRELFTARDYLIDIRVGKNTINAMFQGMKGNIVEHEINGAEIMNVHLSAPEGGFLIEPVGINGPQPTNPSAWGGDQEYASWKWRLAPLKAGSYSLLITLSSYTQNAHSKLHEQQIPISVRVNMVRIAQNVAVGGGLMIAGGMISAFFGDIYELFKEIIIQSSE